MRDESKLRVQSARGSGINSRCPALPLEAHNGPCDYRLARMSVNIKLQPWLENHMES